MSLLITKAACAVFQPYMGFMYYIHIIVFKCLRQIFMQPLLCWIFVLEPKLISSNVLNPERANKAGHVLKFPINTCLGDFHQSLISADTCAAHLTWS